MGSVTPGLDYFRAISGSEAEAKLLQAQFVARRQASDG